jgi:hypothetical protein
MTPPLKKLRPPSGPPCFFQLWVPLTCIEPAFFALVFEVALHVTAPLRYA